MNDYILRLVEKTSQDYIIYEYKIILVYFVKKNKRGMVHGVLRIKPPC